MAASALSARLGTVTPIMNVSSSRKDSLRVSRSNGPLPASVPQTAKPASTIAEVAVSRGPRRSADHSSGSTARNASGARRSAVAKIGLKAIKPIAQATQKMTIDSNSLRRLSKRISAAAHIRITGVTSKAPARSPSHQVSQTEPATARSTKPPAARLITPMVAHSAVGRKDKIAKRATPAGLSKVALPSDSRLIR